MVHRRDAEEILGQTIAECVKQKKPSVSRELYVGAEDESRTHKPCGART